MNARELENVARFLARRRTLAREAVTAGLACAALATPIAFLTFTAAVALIVGAGVALLVGAVSLLSRRDAILRLALEPTAYSLAEVRSYGERLVVLAERQRLAGWLREIVREARVPGNWYLADRVALYAGQIESLANDLASPLAQIRPSSAAACLRLLTHASESPLYNPDVPAEELPAAIRRIRLGISA
jgi:hypothetical protein